MDLIGTAAIRVNALTTKCSDLYVLALLTIHKHYAKVRAYRLGPGKIRAELIGGGVGAYVVVFRREVK